MRVLLSTIGSRGDVQPLAALAVQLSALGQEVRLCAHWAQRIHDLRIGTAHPPVVPTTDSLAAALSHALHPDVAPRARSIADAVRTDGAKAAAQRLTTVDSQSSS
jgi:UDP:flavonoid glycosyltransferase YjiC (YdhE family)